jgi:hypothetical protein
MRLEGGVGDTEVIRTRLRRYIDETKNYIDVYAREGFALYDCGFVIELP